MTEEEMPRPGKSCHLGRLTGGRVPPKPREFAPLLTEGRLMVEQVDPADIVRRCLPVDRVGAVGIAERASARCGDRGSRDDRTILPDVITPLLETAEVGHGDPGPIRRLPVKVRQQRCLVKSVADTGDTVLEREAGDSHRPILVDHRPPGGRTLVHLYLCVVVVPLLSSEVADDPIDKVCRAYRSVDMDRVIKAHQRHRADQPRQTEAVIAMQVGDKDAVQARYRHTVPHHLELSPLSTVDEEGLIASQSHHLCGRVVTKGGLGCTAAQHLDIHPDADLRLTHRGIRSQ